MRCFSRCADTDVCRRTGIVRTLHFHSAHFENISRCTSHPLALLAASGTLPQIVARAAMGHGFTFFHQCTIRTLYRRLPAFKSVVTGQEYRHSVNRQHIPASAPFRHHLLATADGCICFIVRETAQAGCKRFQGRQNSTLKHLRRHTDYCISRTSIILQRILSLNLFLQRAPTQPYRIY